MQFARFLVRETKFLRILFVFSMLLVLVFALPESYEKEMPKGIEWVFYIVVFSVFTGVGFVYSATQRNELDSSKKSPIFDQAATVVISLSILLAPIYFFRPKLFGIVLLIYAVEFGLMVGKYRNVRLKSK